jgi:membrane protease YdiL (CAAX protease family)
MLRRMPGAFDHGMVLFLVLLFPIRAWSFGFRRLARAAPGDVPRVRASLYREAIALQWGLTAIVVVAWFALGRSAFDLGLAPRFGAWAESLPRGLAAAFPWWLVVPAAAVAIAAALLMAGRSARRSAESLAAVREQLREFERLMPTNAREWRVFLALSLTAGLCEELLFRGYLQWYVGSWLEAWPAALVVSALFGLGHLYQGPRGILKTGMAGLFFAAVTLFAGSIWPAAALHALLDAHSGHLAWHAIERAREPSPSPADHVVGDEA